MKKRVKIQWFVYALVFALFLYIGYKVPYCHDEWRWGTDARFQLMKRGFAGYNGRYLGNLIPAELWMAGSICKFCSTGFSVFDLL